MKKILQKEAKILRKIAEAVPIKEIGTNKINKILDEMREALASQDDGVAIAGPQIGHSIRIFIVSGNIAKIIDSKKRKTTETDSGDRAGDQTNENVLPDVVFINPVIKKVSKEKNIVEEGCLSVRYLYGKVSRSVKATVEAYDENGKKFSRGGTGLLAQIFQHEVDHLDGILFVDKAKFVEEIIPEHIKNVGKK